MNNQRVRFSIASQAAWAPGVETHDAWRAWANGDLTMASSGEPLLRTVSPILRRRAGLLSKMALEVSYRCLGPKTNVPAIFCSRHGEASRSVDLLIDLARDSPLSPTSFSLSVHNATAGLFSIARADRASSIGVAGGKSSVEYAVIETCGLLADGAPEVLLVVYDCPLPKIYAEFQDCHEVPFAWAWLMQPPRDDVVSLTWSPCASDEYINLGEWSPGLEILRFYLRHDSRLERVSDRHRWFWSRDA